MNFDEIVRKIIERNCSRVILQLAREFVAQTSVAPNIRAERPILPFHK
jgi:hypothetical protein